MLKNLVIDNIALIGHIEINFSEGLTVLSGETGSGKSIVVDSLAFVLGDRADKMLIKHGEDAAEVTALFEVDEHSRVLDRLEEYGYGRDTEILLYRKMSLNGKNEIRIQGKTATLVILKEICAELVDIFGQGQHLALLNEKNQLAVLDSFCNHQKICEQLYGYRPRLAEINKELKALGGDEAERERLLDILYQIDEIASASISAEEEAELQTTHKRLVNSEKIAAALGEAGNFLDSDTGAIFCLSQAAALLRSISGLEDSAEELTERLNSTRLETEDILTQVQDLLAQTEFSPAQADRIEERLEKYRQLKRKYGGDVEQVLIFLQNARSKYDNLSNASERIRQLEVEKDDIIREMYKLSRQKSAERKRVASLLAQRIVRELSDLGMRGTAFEVRFNEEPTQEQYARSPSADGYDSVEFLMSANVGEPLKPLSKVISGGEMSRFMLAVKNITALAENIPTMIFDEIDAGISGNMAQMVACKLANVSSGKTDGYQCIVITHLPQIAAMADINLHIAKHERDGKTYTEVTMLTDEETRATEVARLMGGIGAHAMINATELLQWSSQYKKQLH